MVSYPRLYVSAKVHAKAKKLASKKKLTLKEMSEKIAVAGLKSLGA